MSFSFAPPRVPPVSSMGWQATAAAWRGCCLEVFSRAEHSIDDCITELEVRGRCVGRDSHHPGAKGRLKALVEYLEREPFSPHCRESIRKLCAWEEKWDDRLWFAHGRMNVAPGQITLSLTTHDGKTRSKRRDRSFDRFAMLAVLTEIDAAEHALRIQLGQIRAAARRSVPGAD